MTATEPKPSTEHPADENRAVIVAPQPERTAVVLWGTDKPREMTARMAEIADAMRAVVEDRGLFTDIQGRKYVNIEGWSMVGAMLGVFPRTERTEIIESGHLDELRVIKRGRNGNYEKVYPAYDGPITFRASVSLVTRDGGVIGGAEAMCSRREEQWRDRDDNQIASMSQTRGAAKAYRMSLGFIMPLSGYAGTPAEEMPHDAIEATFREVPEPSRPPQAREVQRGPSPRVEANPTEEPSADGISNVGQLLTYAINLRKYHGLPIERDAALNALGVKATGEIAAAYTGKWDEAAKKIRDAFVPQSEFTPSTPATSLTDDQREAYDSLIAGGTSPEDAMLAAAQ